MIFLLLILEFNSEANFYIRKSPPNNIRFNHNNYAMWIYQKNKKTKTSVRGLSCKKKIALKC